MALIEKSRRARSSSTLAPWSGETSHTQGRGARRELDRGSAAGTRARACRLLRSPLHGQVDVHDRAAQERVAHRAADDPGRDARQRLARDANRLGLVQRVEAHPCTRGTRGVSPHVTS
jgi:hypothetical protein